MNFQAVSGVGHDIEDMQIFLLNMYFISRVKLTIFIFMSGDAKNEI